MKNTTVIAAKIFGFAVVLTLVIAGMYGAIKMSHQYGYEHGAQDAMNGAAQFFIENCDREIPINMPNGKQYICKRANKF